jgi:hypothetical protein
MRGDEMSDETRDGVPEPLPRNWLPEPLPADGEPAWELRVDRIMTSLEPGLGRLATLARSTAAPWWEVMGSWWRPAAGMAAAAAALLLFAARQAPPTGAGGDAVTLGLIATGGDPVAIWAASGIEADPVLALIAWEGRGLEPETTSPADGGER